jgi:hypothetical protein
MFKKWFQIIIGLLAVCGIFYFTPSSIIYTLVIIPSLLISILSKRKIFVLIGFVSAFGVLVIPLFASQGSFFYMVYDLITPEGFDLSWQNGLPIFFEPMLTASILIIICFIAFAYFWKRQQYDSWLVEVFSYTLLTVLFLYLIFSIISVALNLYDLLKTNIIALYIWEILFVWLPFFALFFIIYYLLGYVFRRFH